MIKRVFVLFCLVLAITLSSGAFVGSSAFALDDDEKEHLERLNTLYKNSDYPAAGEKALKEGWYGPGGYFSIVKIVIALIGFWIWVYMIDWMNRDAEVLQNPNRGIWNSINCGLLVLVGGVGTLLLIPIFWIGLGASFVAFWAPVITYALIRNKPLPPHERVLTPDHVYFCIARMLRMKTPDPKQSHELGPPVALKALQKDTAKIDLDARTLLARNHEGFNPYRFILANAIFKRATGVMFDYSETECQVRFQIDGVWHLTQTLTREQSDPMLESAKLLIGANPNERRKRQQGTFVAVVEKKHNYEAEFASQGVPTGEKVLIQFTITKVPFKTSDDIGLVDPELSKVRHALALPEGVMLISAPLANGLRSTTNVFMKIADRYVRDFVAVEDERNKYESVENLPITFYDSAKGETPMSVLPDVFFKEPQVLVLRDMINKETLERCCNETENTRLIITTVRGKDCAEAIFQLLALGISPQLLASKLATVTCQRLIRRLCTDCKEAFQPPPAMLQKLGIRPGTVENLYRIRSEPKEGEKKPLPCLRCNEIGYYDRTAMFEILEMNDAFRKVILAAKSVEQMRQGFQQAGHKGFVPSGLALVANGTTSIDELTRILKM
ncbi:MAG: Flp pilus assembly complex ATPase component TadA [Planctomycetaceae bacterium]|nr:Flp pilus assembly complex ATPase component TadA [Planctomycetaceae bacterium]